MRVINLVKGVFLLEEDDGDSEANLVAAIFSSSSNLLKSCSNFWCRTCSCASILSWRVCSWRATGASTFESIKYKKFSLEEFWFSVDKSFQSFFNSFFLLFWIAPPGC